MVQKMMGIAGQHIEFAEGEDWKVSPPELSRARCSSSICPPCIQYVFLIILNADTAPLSDSCADALSPQASL